MARVPALVAVIAPMILFWQLTAPVPVVDPIFIPYTFAPVAAAVMLTDPVPVAAPMVFAVTVPMFTAPVAVEGILIAVQEEAPASPQVKFLMVFPCTLVVVLTAGPTFKFIAIKVLVKAFVLAQVPLQEAELPPIKLPLMEISVEVRSEILMGT